jgi:hypothetical protein
MFFCGDFRSSEGRDDDASGSAAEHSDGGAAHLDEVGSSNPLDHADGAQAVKVSGTQRMTSG